MSDVSQGSPRREVLGYGKDKGFFSSGAPTELRNLQPIPPEFIWADPQGDNVNSYLRFKNLYQNEDRLDQPDLIIDVALKEVAEPAIASSSSSSSSNPPQESAVNEPPTPAAAPSSPSVAAPSVTQPTQTVSIQIPSGAMPGQMLSAQMPDGQMVQVTIPPGVGAGMSLSVQYTPRAAE